MKFNTFRIVATEFKTSMATAISNLHIHKLYNCSLLIINYESRLFRDYCLKQYFD